MKTRKERTESEAEANTCGFGDSSRITASLARVEKGREKERKSVVQQLFIVSGSVGRWDRCCAGNDAFLCMFTSNRQSTERGAILKTKDNGAAKLFSLRSLVC